MTTKVRGSVLANTAVTAGTYGSGSIIPVVTVDAQGRITSASNTSLSSTGVIAGSYGSGTTTPVFTVDATGRITSATAVTITGGSAGIGATTFTRTPFTATSGQSSFAAEHTVGYVQVYLNGVLLPANDYTSNGTHIILGTAAMNNDGVEIFAYDVNKVLSLANGQAGQVLYQSANGSTSFTANGTIGQYLTSGGTGAPYWSAQTAVQISTSSQLGTTLQPQFASLGVGTAASGVTGEIRAANNITAYYSSDIKFKENVQSIENALEKTASIGGKTFDWKDDYLQSHGGEDDYFLRKSDFGVIAQDVQQHFPLAVRTREDGSLAVDYEKLCALAFQAIAELKTRVEELEGKIK